MSSLDMPPITKKTQDNNAAGGGSNGNTEHVFSGGAAETENIPRPPEENHGTTAGDIVTELRGLLGQDVVLLPIPSREKGASHLRLAKYDARPDE